MQRIQGPGGVMVSFARYGRGTPLVLVHGGFSDHLTNWQEAEGMLAERFDVYAVARRGRGQTSATTGHTVMDEAEDVVAVLRSIGEPVSLLGHSYGALCAVEAAARYPAGVRDLTLYEPPDPSIASPETVALLAGFGEREDWDGMVEAFMRDVVRVPEEEIAAIRETPFWSVWTVDARATLGDLRAIERHRIDVERFRVLTMPVQFLIGSESPREIYLTDALAAVLPDVRIRVLEGQAHEGMTTAPALFVEAISEFLLAPAAV